MKRQKILFFIVVIALFGCSGSTNKLKTGKGFFYFKNAANQENPEIKVWYYLPPKFSENSQILFVMHGNKRNGKTYRNQWVKIAERNNAILVVPEFSRKYFPLDDNYNMGNMFEMDSAEHLLKENPKSLWSYSVLEPLFDYVKKLTGSKQKHYLLYGHSAGSQFVHRFLLFIPESRVSTAVSANAGWYTYPDTSVIFPYGLKGTVANMQNIKKFFEKHLIVLLGTADTIRTSPSLRRTPEAMKQGAFRLQRGKNFFAFCQRKAAELGLKFNWELKFAPNVGHSNNKMKLFAEKYLFNN